MIDPFANAVENTAPAGGVADEPVSVTVTTEKPEGGVKGLSITYKGTSRDPWIVAYADTVDAALAIAADPKLPELMKQVRRGSEFFVGTLPAPQAASPSSLPTAPQGGTQGQAKPHPPGVPVMTCAHGVRNYVSKDSWQALFCAAPQDTPADQKCPPLWRDKNGNYKAK